MPSGSTVESGNTSLSVILSAVLSPTIVNTITTSDQAFTIPGLVAGDVCVVTKPTAQTGLALVAARCTANNTLNLTFMNPTAGGITPTAGERYLIHVTRFENQNLQNPPGALV